MKKVSYLSLLIMCLFVSCSTTNNKTVSKHPLQEALPSTIKFSPEFKLFWLSFVKEANESKSMSSYRPSEDLLNRFTIVKSDNEYVMSGFLRVNESFDTTAFEKAGGHLTKMTSDTYTFQFPLKNITYMFETQGIVSIEMSRKIYNLN